MAENYQLKAKPKLPDMAVLTRIIERAHAHAMTMIYLANHRDDIEKGDPKVGGHPTASSSALHILSTLHLFVRNPHDFMASKPHSSPADHALHYLLRNFFENQHSTRMSDEKSRLAMSHLRHFSSTGEPVFQSYHSIFDPDNWNYLPSGSVGIPPVNAVYLAHAFRMAEKHGWEIPKDAHFWCLMGDAEYREGSLAEVLPEVSERGLGNVTWIVDYNRQSLDGHRILNEEALGGKDSDRIVKTALANGWDSEQLRHGRFRKEVFSRGSGGESLQNVLETALSDYEFNSLLAGMDAKKILEAVGRYDKGAQKFLGELSESDVKRFWSDLAGHDVPTLIEAFEEAKKDPDKPVLYVIHTLKGWNLRSAAKSANHSAMMSEEEVFELRARYGLQGKDLKAFEHFEEKSAEGQYLKSRGDWLWDGIQAVKKLKTRNTERVRKQALASHALTDFPKEVGINLKLVPMAHTQWMLGQITAKLARIADTSLVDSQVQPPLKPLTDEERKLKVVADTIFTMAPDVGTSTNLNSAMDGRIFGPEGSDFEAQYGVKDAKTPDIVPHESDKSRFVRFDIAEGNTMSCMGSYGAMGALAGIPMLPIMTVYDFFLKRALDQLFYNLYWNSSFVCVGTPSGVTLSPEGAQHGWKSDIQIANGIFWEPAFAIEMDWILAESFRRHLNTALGDLSVENSNVGRSGVIIRGVTRSLEQKELLKRLKQHKRFESRSDEDIFEQTRKDCLEGAYFLQDFRGQPGYRPGENVVNIFAMGSLVTEALAASDKLVKDGIFANVIQVSSHDLLLGNLAEKTQYRHLRQGLGIHGDLVLRPMTNSANGNGHYPPAVFGPSPLQGAGGQAQLLTLGGRRIPIVSVHDGEPGLLDNIGGVVGTLQKTLAVRKHSKCGRPSDVYRYHGIDQDSVAKAAMQLLAESAVAPVQVDTQTVSVPFSAAQL